MRSPAKKNEYPLSMRLPEQDIAIIDRAADLRGSSRTEFVREAAVRAAEAIIMENTLLRGHGRCYTILQDCRLPRALSRQR